MFHCFRARIEKMLDNGYEVVPLTDEDRERAKFYQEQYLRLKA